MLLKQLLLGLALPALAAAAVLVAACRPWRRGKKRSSSWAGPLGLGTGYVTGHLALFGWPGLPPVESWNWMPHVAVVATAACMLAASSRLPRRARWVMAVVVAAATAQLLVPQWQESRLAWTGALAGAVAAVWMALLPLGKRSSVSPWLAVLIAATAAALVLERAACAKFAQLAGALAASASACLVLVPRESWSKAGPGFAGNGAVLLVGLMFSGLFNHFSDVPAVCFLLVAMASLMAWVGQWAPVRRCKAGKRLGIEAAAVLIPAGVALVLAYAAADSNGRPPYQLVYPNDAQAGAAR